MKIQYTTIEEIKKNSKNIDSIYVLVPIEMCVFVLENNLENTFRFYLLLKLIYTCGKVKFTKEEIRFLAFVINVTTRTIISQIKKLEELNWIRLNNKTHYYIIFSFDKLRNSNDWISRASIEFYFEDISRIRPILGAALYGYLHKNFWRKVKREGIVTIKGVTYQSLSSSFNYKNQWAPISVYGVKKIFNISIAKLSRLKTLASIDGLIKIKKCYVEYDVDESYALHIKKYYPDRTRNLIRKNDKFYLQQIDLILPNFDIRRRKKLEP